MSEWISVSDRLPEKGQIVLIYEGGSKVPISSRYSPQDCKYSQWPEICNCGGVECHPGLHQEEVTHWMPLPKPPTD